MAQATTNRKQAAEIHYIGRCQFKASGAVLYGVRSGEQVYHVTILYGEITGCLDEHGIACQGFYYRHTCKHTKLAASLEAEHATAQEQLAEAAIIAPLVLGKVFTADLPVHLDDELTNQSDPDGWTEDQQRQWHITNFLDVA